MAGKGVRLGSELKSYYSQLMKLYKDNVVAYLPLDETTGTTAFEKIAARNLTYVSATLNSDQFEKKPTVYFDGNGRIKDTLLANSVINKDEVTIICWAKAKAFNVGYSKFNNVFCFRYPSSSFPGITLANSASGTYFGFSRSTPGNVGYSYIMPPTKATNWVMIAYTWSLSQQIAIPYFNGALINKSGGSSTATPVIVSDLTNFDTSLTAIASGRTFSQDNPFIGNLAHFTVLNKCLSQTELLKLFNYPNVIFDGDSRTVGRAYPTCTLLDKIFTPHVVAVSGNTIVNRITAAPIVLDTKYISGKKNIAILFCGVNDGSARASAQTIYNSIKAWSDGRKAAGFKTIVCTEIDAQDASRNAAGWHSTIMPQLNALLRADHSFADGFADVGANPNLQDATNTTYFSADKVHPTLAGSTEIASVVAPIIHSML